MRYPHPVIAKEGWLILIGALFASILVSALWGWWSLPLWLFTLFALQFFRDPPRQPPNEQDAILSPADGRVVVVERCIDPFVDGREALKISVFMNVFNVHSNRVPITGTVEKIRYFPGKFFNADLDKASLHNERNAMILKTTNGETVTVVQVAGLIARRILCYVGVGEQLQRGQRYGFIRFGSRVDLYLPVQARPLVGIGEKVYATSTPLAKL